MACDAGLPQRPDLLMIDTGCVWGHELATVRLDGPTRIVGITTVA
jgi:hypothetical protein